ncbi:MAG: homocysteine S-methyltransferase family protein [Clostridiales Family XIII bacterium]|nr:homocysteine S-methyltransferase family protein [Clostridiales Family XIII bacterium]
MEEKNLFGRLLAERGRLLLDSAMGSALIEGGLGRGESSSAMNLRAPEVVQAIHRRNIEAGCDIVTANTFGVGALLIQGQKAKWPAADALRAGLVCAREAAAAGGPGGRRIYTALDIGPLGPIIGFTDGLGHEEARGFFAEQVRAGADAGADFVFIETMSDLEEMRDAVLAAKENTSLPVLCTMTFAENGRTFMGTDPAAFAKAAQSAGADAIGVNCSLGPLAMVPIIREIAAAARVPVAAQPNAGLPVMKNGEACYEMTAGEFADGIEQLLNAGADIVGGCCGTTPAFIARIRAMMTSGKC